MAALLRAIEATAAGLTVCEVARGMRLLGSSYDGVSAYQVLTGTLWVRLGEAAPLSIQAGSLLLVPAGIRPVLAADQASLATGSLLDGQASVRRRNGWQVADATGGRACDLVVTAARITGTAAVPLASPAVLPVRVSTVGQHMAGLLRTELDREDGSPALAVTLMSGCITIGLRNGIELVAEASDRRDDLVARAVSAINSRPSEAHSVDSLAEIAGMSRSTFIRQFGRVVGTTPNEYVQRVRLADAASMLRSTELPVQTIAASSGFASRSHFSRVFRAAYGHDPRAFRCSPAAADTVEEA